MKAPIPLTEAVRLEALRQYDLLDTAPEQEFDDLTQLAAQICGTPISTITLIDRERQWFKSRIGLAASETPRDVSFCAHTILGSDLLIVPDATSDERFVDNLFVTSEPHIRFYAGMPLVTPEGHAVGTLCVIDTVPRQLDQAQQEALRRLGRQAVALLEARPYPIAESETTEKGQSRQARQQAEVQRRALTTKATRRDADSLKASEVRYRRLFEAAKDGILILDAATGKIEDANPYLCQLLGYTPEELLDQQLWEIGTFHDIAANQDAFQTLQEKEYIRYDDLPLETKTGNIISVEFVSNVYDAANKKVIQCNIRDISERKRAATAERESQHFLQSTLDALASHIAVIDEVGNVIAVNQAWRQFSEDNDGDVTSCGLGANYLEVCESATGNWAEESAAVAHGIHEVMAGRQQQFCVEYPCHSPAEQRWFSVRVTRFVGEGPLRVVVAHENISERKRAEDLMRTSEATLAVAQQIAHLGSWVWSLQKTETFDANPLSWSDEVFRIFGYQPNAVEVSFDFFINGVHPDDRARIEAKLGSALTMGENYHVEHRVVRPDGTERVVQENSEIIYDEAGQPVKMVGTIQDITEQKHAEEVLRRNSEQLRALAAKLSTIREEERTQISREVHDVLGQALTGLKMDVAWLEQSLIASNFGPTDAMRQKTQFMLHFIDSTIQSVQRIASQLRPAVLDDFGLEAAIEWQMQEWNERTHINCDYVSSLGEMLLTPEQTTAVFRILQEALTNIARHAAASNINVLLEENAGYLVLEVQDDGRGMNERRVATTNVKSLGLLGMEERAKVVGGEVTINSSAGQGTTVTVRIPLSAEQISRVGHQEEPA